MYEGRFEAGFSSTLIFPQIFANFICWVSFCRSEIELNFWINPISILFVYNYHLEYTYSEEKNEFACYYPVSTFHTSCNQGNLTSFLNEHIIRISIHYCTYENADLFNPLEGLCIWFVLF